MDRSIFQSYTGNAIVNNALQTIEALADLKSVVEITPRVLLEQYEKHDLPQVNKRLKNYTMIFSKNGPLFNDASYGEKIYDSLLRLIINNFESDGTHQCEITGLKFTTTFEEFYERVLNEIGYPKEKIAEKDKTINRCWFPLSSSLGSDAQALPQAKFAIKIHPICLVIVQFLPLSAFHLYKGAILLIDSIDFKFVRKYKRGHVEKICKLLELKGSNEKIENLKGTKAHYILEALDILDDKKQALLNPV